jgi:hypothetical protein
LKSHVADGRTVKETHEKLKVDNKERLNCYYAHAESTDGLQRRCYWILDRTLDDIVLVHYFCSSTSRAGPRGATVIARGDGIAAQRPQRAAARNARWDRFGDDSDGEARLSGGGGTAQLGGTRRRARRRARQSDDDDDYDDFEGDEDEEDGSNLAQNAGNEDDDEDYDPGLLVPVQPAVMQPRRVQRQQPQPLRQDSFMQMIEGISVGTTSITHPTLSNIPSLRGDAPMPSIPMHPSHDPGVLHVTQSQAQALAQGMSLNAGGMVAGRFPLSPQRFSSGLGAVLEGDPSLLSMSKLLRDHQGGSQTVLLQQLSWSRQALEFTAEDLAHFGGGGGDASSGQDQPASTSAADDPTGSPTRQSFTVLLPPGPAEGGSLDLAKLLTSAGVTFPGAASFGIHKDLSMELSAGAGVLSEPQRDSSMGVPPATATTAGTSATEAAALGGTDTEGTAEGTSPLACAHHHPESSQQPTKVETLRRVVAPGFRQKRGSSQGLAELASHRGSGASLDAPDSDAVAAAAPRRKHPLASPAPPNAQDRVAHAAAAAAAVADERREERLQQRRQARAAEGGAVSGEESGTPVSHGTATGISVQSVAHNQIIAADDDVAALSKLGAYSEDEDTELIHAPNQLFRLTSHVFRTPPAAAGPIEAGAHGAEAVSGRADAEEATRTLLKHMSIDQQRGEEARALATMAGNGTMPQR